jgi:amino acid transporter
VNFDDNLELPSAGPSALATGAPALVANALSIWQVLFFGVATMGVASMLALNAGGILHLAGYGSWLATALGAVLVLFIAAPIVIFAHRHTVTGSLMSLLGEEFGARWRPIPGAALLGGYLVALMNIATSAVLYVGSFLNDLGWTVASSPFMQITVVVVIIPVAVWFTTLGITTSMKVSIWLGNACLPFVLIVCIASAIRGGVDFGPQFRLEGVTTSTLIAGMFFAVAAFVGFEGLTALGKETKDARRGIPIVLVVVILSMSIAILVSALFQIPLLMRHRDLLDAGVSPNAVLAEIGGVQWTNIPTDGLLAAVCVATQIGFTNTAARVFATMGIDGGLPRWVGRIHPTRHTPVNAACLVGGVALVLTMAHILISKEGALQAIASQAVLLSNLWLVAYLVTCVGGVVYGLRRSTRSVLAVVLSSVGAVGIVWAWAWPVLNPDGSFSSVAPWIAIVWTVVVAFVIAYGERRRRRTSEADKTLVVTTSPPRGVVQ